MARKDGFTQAISAAKSGALERSGHRIDDDSLNPHSKHVGQNTREYPLRNRVGGTIASIRGQSCANTVD